MSTDCDPSIQPIFERLVETYAGWSRLQIDMQLEPSSFLDGLFIGFMNGLRGKLDGGAGEASDRRRQLLEEIQQTYFEVERIVSTISIAYGNSSFLAGTLAMFSDALADTI